MYRGHTPERKIREVLNKIPTKVNKISRDKNTRKSSKICNVKSKRRVDSVLPRLI